MNLESVLIIIHVIAAIAIVALVLIQRGKGADVGASFGSGASQTMFGSVGSGNFFTRATTVLTVVFFATSLSLAVVARQRADATGEGSPLLQGDIPAGEQQAGQSPDASQQPQGAGQPAGESGQQSSSGSDTGGGDVPTVEQQTQGDVPVVEESQEETSSGE